MRRHRETLMGQPEATVVYRVDVVDRRTMKSRCVAVLARSDIEAFDAIREQYPRRRFVIVDRATGEEVDLDGR
jgi:hypothetical protein